MPVTGLSHPHRLSLPTEPGQRQGTLSLLMVAATLGAFVIAVALGMLFQQVVFGLEEEQLLADAGFWGSVVAVVLAAFIVLPALVGVVSASGYAVSAHIVWEPWGSPSTR